MLSQRPSSGSWMEGVTREDMEDDMAVDRRCRDELANGQQVSSVPNWLWHPHR
jgi:hypothetical protein